jgi:O-succinylbenzoate synthase
MATLAGFTLPGDVSASARYWKDDIIEPPVTVSANGTILAPDKPGIGFEVNLSKIDSVTVRKEMIA